MDKEILEFIASCDDFETMKIRANRMLKEMPQEIPVAVKRVKEKKGVTKK